MRKAAARRFEVSLSAKSVTRFLIVSYFVGLALGLVQGVDVAVLFESMMSQNAANLLSGALVGFLALTILLPKQRRTAILLLALLVFWASYLTMMIRSGPEHIAAFWRDLALIGGLILTYGASARGIRIDLTRAVGAMTARLRAALPFTARTHDTAIPLADDQLQQPKPSSAAHPKRVRSEIYRQDFEVVRVL